MYFDFYFATIFFLVIICSSLIIGFLLLKYTHKNALNKRILAADLDRKKALYTVKIKGVERFALYLERIKIDNLVTRIEPVSKNITHYKLLLNATIEQELNHNAVQRIYISDKTYQSILQATQETIKYIEKTTLPNNNETDLIQFKALLLSNNSAISSRVENTIRLLKDELKFL